MTPRARARTAAAFAVTVAAKLALPGTLPAQRVLDWPVRVTAGADALVPGAAAAFWNPAGVTAVEGRFEVVVVHDAGPRSLEIGGVGFAAAARWRGRTGFALGYRHLAMEPIPRTTTSPLPEPGVPEVRVAEDHFTVAAAYRLAPGLGIGGTVRHWRSDLDGRRDVATTGAAGVRWNTPLPLRPVLGVAVYSADESRRWHAGVEAGAPVPGDSGWELGASYGLAGGGPARRAGQRLALTGRRGGASISAGAARATAAGDVGWEAVLAASLRIERYALGIVREELASGLGAAWSYRLHVTF